jgi:hypothetical protein
MKFTAEQIAGILEVVGNPKAEVQQLSKIEGKEGSLTFI